MTTLRDVVLRVVDAAPCSVRKLAAAAGIAPATLTKARTGERSITPATADAIAAALERWARDCQRGARAIRQARTPRKGTAR